MLADVLNRLNNHPNPDEMRDIVLDIANAFAEKDDDDVDPEERRLFGSFITTALDRLGEDLRALVVEAICDSTLVSPDIAVQTAHHESDEVALPFLEFSPALDEQQLVTLAESLPEKRQLAIARREYLSKAVSEALIVHGTDKVLITLSNNQTAEFSSIGFAQLFHRVGDNPLVQASLADRSMNQPNFGQSILNSVDESLRAKLGNFIELIDTHAYSAIVRSAANGVAQKTSDELQNRISRRDVLHKVQSGILSFDAAFAGYCATDRLQDCVWSLAEQLKLPERLVYSNFARQESDRIAILCRAAGVSDSTYSTFSKMRLPLVDQDVEKIGRTVREYAELDASQARRAVRIVRMRFVESDPKTGDLLAKSA